MVYETGIESQRNFRFPPEFLFQVFIDVFYYLILILFFEITALINELLNDKIWKKLFAIFPNRKTIPITIS